MVNYDNILTEAIEMNNDVLNHTENKSEEFKKKLETDYKNLHDNFSSLFKLILSGNMDIDRLKYMINMLKKVEKNELTEYDASVSVGKVLVKDFITDKK